MGVWVCVRLCVNAGVRECGSCPWPTECVTCNEQRFGRQTRERETDERETDKTRIANEKERETESVKKQLKEKKKRGRVMDNKRERGT